MKKTIFGLVLMATSVIFSSCGTVGMIGILYTGNTAPGAVTSNSVGNAITANIKPIFLISIFFT